MANVEDELERSGSSGAALGNARGLFKKGGSGRAAHVMDAAGVDNLDEVRGVARRDILHETRHTKSTVLRSAAPTALWACYTLLFVMMPRVYRVQHLVDVAGLWKHEHACFAFCAA
jgi:hypothetical protein